MPQAWIPVPAPSIARRPASIAVTGWLPIGPEAGT